MRCCQLPFWVVLRIDENLAGALFLPSVFAFCRTRSTLMDHGTQSQRSIASSRWQLLRRALLSNSDGSFHKVGDQNASGGTRWGSIHEFPGYRMLQQHSRDRTHFNAQGNPNDIIKRLCRIHVPPIIGHKTILFPLHDEFSTNSSSMSIGDTSKEWIEVLETIVDSLLAIRALDPLRMSVKLILQMAVKHPEQPCYPPAAISKESDWLSKKIKAQLDCAEHYKTTKGESFWANLQCQIRYPMTTPETNTSLLNFGEAISNDNDAVVLYVSWSSSTNLTYRYRVQRYWVPSLHDNSLSFQTSQNATESQSVILIREHQKDLSKRRFTAAELMSHIENSGIDNTGNVCIWDCSQTLAWAVLQTYLSASTSSSNVALTGSMDNQSNSSVNICSPRSIAELGSGMAALPSLCLLARWNEYIACLDTMHSSQVFPLQSVLITDGHDDCVRNNRINIRLMDAVSNISTRRRPAIVCTKLVWEFNPTDNIESVENSDCDTPTDYMIQQTSVAVADWTLIADCTHFEHYHRQLLWTAIRGTTVGGIIWLCQPNRGQSLQRFLMLVDSINNHVTCISMEQQPKPSMLLEIVESKYELLDQMHASFSLRNTNSTQSYDPDRHQPRIIRLHKLRSHTRTDLQHIVEWSN
jgi:hypothetical protein